MSKPFVTFHTVTFQYDAAPAPIFQRISFQAAPGWTGVVGANGTGKTTLLKLATGVLKPDEGDIDAPSQAVYCPQRTDKIPEQAGEFFFEKTKSAYVIKSRLGIHNDWIHRWETLSHGERKRMQIAVALWLEPVLLAIDEPTNHVDAQARIIITKALETFQGLGLLVSHDRELLDSLCRQCLFIEPPQIVIRPGGVTRGLSLAKTEQETIKKRQTVKKKEYKRLHRLAVSRREKAQQADKRRSKRGIAPKDHDAKAKIDLARLSGKDASAGKLLRQLDGRLKRVTEDVESLQVKKEYTLGIWLPGSRSSRDFLLQLPAGSLALGKEKQLLYPDLFILPDDRIAVTGPNGAGKSTLIRKILPLLHVPLEHITYVPQEISLEESQNLLAQVHRLPNEQLGHLMTIVSRLGSRPHRLLESREPSPGEVRKLLLALGMTRVPHIIILDEPTNHMDLPSIQCLEEALADCPCSLVLVSHDEIFLKKLTGTHWHISPGSQVKNTWVMQIQT
ncbi:MAG: ATP-binding cassette domain-containing protein [bacterium]